MIKTFNEMYKRFIIEFTEEYNMLYFNDIVLTNKQFQQRVIEIKKHLICLGVRQGTGVGYTMNNNLDIIPLFIAIAALGAYAVPQFAGIPPIARVMLYKKAEVSLIITNVSMLEQLRKAATKIDAVFDYAVIEPSEQYKSIAGAPKIDINTEAYQIKGEEGELPLMIATSSGTTGIPKMVCMTQNNVGSEMIVSRDLMEYSREGRKPGDPVDISSMAFPFSTSVMIVLCGILFQKRAMVFSDDMSTRRYLKDVERRKAMSLCCPPAFYESILLLKDTNTYDLSSVTEIAGGMDFCPPESIKRLKEMFPNLRVYSNGYGLVETCNVFMYTEVDISGEELLHTTTLHLSEHADNVIEIRDEDGKVIENGKIGELYVKGPNVVKGYMSTPKTVMEEFPDGWMKTGDIVKKESETCVTLLGRRKYFIKRGGKTVSPIVVQNEINKTKGVKDSGVVGVPHRLFGEMIWAFVVKEEDSDVSLKEIKKQCKETLPYYMLPDQVTFIESIPKSPAVGKVDFEKLRKMGRDRLGVH